MPRGGKRPGAGRPKGGKNRKTIERMKIAEQAAAGGITPLELMLQLMRSLWDEGTRASRTAAAKLATEAAPFVHPRLTAIDQHINVERFVFEVPLEAQSEAQWLTQITHNKPQ
jgi:hypothetical protein